jgi:methylmalonyl-CoA/ethylmalonyl-CoA epimerase
MIKVKRIDHVAIAVGDLDGATRTFGDLFGLCAGPRERVAHQGTDVAFLYDAFHKGVNLASHEMSNLATNEPARTGPSASSALELIAPAGQAANASLERFLDRRGPGLHHVCFEVDDLPGALAELKAAGVRLIDDVPRPGARGHLVAFLHPASTGGVLFELCATPDGAQA